MQRILAGIIVLVFVAPLLLGVARNLKRRRRQGKAGELDLTGSKFWDVD
ncbi:resistance to Congo red protein [Natroniella acetigena]|nr:resistance to Congo red protein [Natroniella acetigena]MCK8826385.1 resistance to Congo red protein [Natroniella acetigena]